MALSTPGHTNGCMSFVCHKAKIVFTGDALLIRGCGRTDFQNGLILLLKFKKSFERVVLFYFFKGSSEKLFDSIYSKLLCLPDEYIVFPGHDYSGQTSSSIGEEKRFNPRLIQSKRDFVETMKRLQLPLPKLIHVAVPKNMACGIIDEQ